MADRMHGSPTARSVNNNLTIPDKTQFLFPVWYLYDYMAEGPKYLTPPRLQLNTDQMLYDLHQRFQDQGKPSDSGGGSDAITLSPVNAGMPWPTAIETVRQNKHWQAALDMTIHMLTLFANDISAQSLFKSNGRSYADVAAKALVGIEDNWMRFPIYMFPEASEERMRLLAAVNVFIFVFDDVWEMHDEHQVPEIINDFVSRITSHERNHHKRTPLQSMIDSVMQQIHEQDRLCGNGGKQVIEGMIRFFSRHPPQGEFTDLESYLKYRREDVALYYLLACAKFSLGSSVDLDKTSLKRLYHRIGDHLSIANDLGSWEKEKHAFDTNQIEHLINTVGVVKRLLCLPDYIVSMNITYAMQLELECAIDKEIQTLLQGNMLDTEETRLLTSILLLMPGNVMASLIMRRYGGEKTRLSTLGFKTK